MPVHEVAAGECLSSIAERYGFAWQTLWLHENNAPLRELRANPNVVKPGDAVFVPDKREREEACVATQTHTFRLKGVPCRFVVRLRDYDGSPRAGVRYSLDVDGTKMEGMADDAGVIMEVIPPNAKTAMLTIPPEPGFEDDGGEEYEFDLGGLLPIDDIQGAQARLKNLGFYHGEENGELDEETKLALSEFQVRHSLPKTGELDSATKQALLDSYGS